MSRSPRALDRNSFRALVRMARDRRGRAAERDAFMLWFLGRTGLRCSEALALRVEDVVLDASPPLVRVRTLKRKHARPSDFDDVYLGAGEARRIRRWIRKGLPRCLGTVHAQGHDPLIPAAFGPSAGPGRMNRRNASRIFQFYARRAQLPAGVTLHSLRHYRGSTLYHTTGDLEFTREQLRHRDLKSTQLYVHHSPEIVQKHLDALEDELES